MHADDRVELDRATEMIIRCAFRVQNALGCGFLEKVYENALLMDLLDSGARAEQQVVYHVRYGQHIVGDYLADLVVDGKVIVEVKACVALNRIHHAQCLNYLKASHLPVALLMNFGLPRLDFCRIANNF